MSRWVGLLLAGACACAACGHAQTTGSASNGWRTPVGYASATHTARLDGTTGVIVNSTTNHGGTYDSRYNTPETAPSDFGIAPPPAQQASAGPYQ